MSLPYLLHCPRPTYPLNLVDRLGHNFWNQQQDAAADLE